MIWKFFFFFHLGKLQLVLDKLKNKEAASFQLKPKYLQQSSAYIKSLLISFSFLFQFKEQEAKYSKAKGDLEKLKEGRNGSFAHEISTERRLHLNTFRKS